MKLIHHQIHGLDYHDLCIYLSERILVESGWEMTDKRWFKDKHMATGDPDIFATKYSAYNGTNGKRTEVVERKVVEIESKLTNANKRKKEAQFRDTVTGVEIIIINLAENKHQDSIMETIKFLEARL